MTTSREIDFDLKLAEYRINGYAVFEDMLPLETVDRLYAAFLPLLEHVRQRDTEVSRVERGNVRTGLGRLQTTNRYTLTVPWVAPFSAPRPELCLCYCRDWYAISQNVEMPQAGYDALSARGKRLLQRCRIVEWD